MREPYFDRNNGIQIGGLDFVLVDIVSIAGNFHGAFPNGQAVRNIERTDDFGEVLDDFGRICDHLRRVLSAYRLGSLDVDGFVDTESLCVRIEAHAQAH